MLATAILYLCNVGIILFHKAQKMNVISNNQNIVNWH